MGWSNPTGWNSRGWSKAAAGGGSSLLTGLVGFWGLDESSGTSAADASGNGHTGTTFNTPTWGTGLVNNCLTFASASSQRAEFSTPAYSLGGAFSVSLWVKAAAVANQVVYSEGNNSDSNTSFWLRQDSLANGTLNVFIKETGGTTLLNSTGSKIYFDGSWHHLVYSENNGTVAIYCDGVLDAHSFNYTPSGTLAPTRSGIAAGLRPTAINYLDGSIDAVGVWSRKITSGEVTSLYNAGAGKQYPF